MMGPKREKRDLGYMYWLGDRVSRGEINDTTIRKNSSTVIDLMVCCYGGLTRKQDSVHVD